MRRRIIFSVVLSMLIILVSMGIISYLNVNASVQRSIQRRLALANIIGRYINYILETNLTRLYDISSSGDINFEDGNWEPERKALKTAYEYSIFTDRIFLLDKFGNLVLSYPSKQDLNVNLLSISYVSRTLSEGKPLISDVYAVDPQKKVIFALVPLKKNGELIGVAGGEINPTNYIFTQVIRSMPVTKSTMIELLDSHGIIISSNEPNRILTMSDHDKMLGNLILNKKEFVGSCHRCHADGNPENKTKDILAMAPLTIAPWAITVREPEEDVFALSTQLRRGFVLLSVISIFTALLLGIGLSRSILNPIQSLIRATKKIGRGQLSKPIEVVGMDEIGILARSFDTMRIRLAESLESIKQHNLALEERVRARTKDLELSRQKLSTLLKKVITAQEEERKRIARELHDETSQGLNALLLYLDLLKMSSARDGELSSKLSQARESVVFVLRGISQMIKDLRPPVLDDFGLEYAIKWVLETHLGEKGIHSHLEIFRNQTEPGKDVSWMLDTSNVELILFRVVQEAIINISKHANATNVNVTLVFNDSAIEVDIIDDGKGFDPETALAVHDPEKDSGFGIIGMKERIALIDGELTITSRPGEGTSIHVMVPLR
jgi:signal transduction histidine kinase